MDATALVAAIVVSEDSLIICRASITAFIGTLRAGNVVAATSLLNEDFASGARREGLLDKGFCPLVLEVMKVLTSLTNCLTVTDLL